ncbi:protein arginine kinase [bacterium]|nr:protein arginine kinase [bacterium]
MPGKKIAFPAWLKNTSPNENIVISSRVRLARNLKKYRFPQAMDKQEREILLSKIEQQILKISLKPALQFYRLRDMDIMQRGILAERGLMHLESAREPDYTGLALGPGQSVSILVNEEDHLRTQVIYEGLNLERCLKMSQQLDEQLSRGFELATHKEFGFLTACPTNVGTGMRASVMLHLPALTLTRGIVQVLQAVLHMSLAVRGFYGEGSELRSMFFQVSNQVTLGRTEEEIIQQLVGVIRQIMDREKDARQKLVKDESALLEDKVGRAKGILSHCRMLGFEEALDLLSILRLGAEVKIIPDIPKTVFNELMLQSQTSHLQLLAKKTLTGTDEFLRRAEWLRKSLKHYLSDKKKRK